MYQKVSCFDTADLKSTQDLKPAVDTIHDLKCKLGATITSLKTFKERNMNWFVAQDNKLLDDAFKNSWDEIDDAVAKLQSHEQLLQDRYVQFDRMLTQVHRILLVLYRCKKRPCQFFYRRSIIGRAR